MPCKHFLFMYPSRSALLSEFLETASRKSPSEGYAVETGLCILSVKDVGREAEGNVVITEEV